MYYALQKKINILYLAFFLIFFASLSIPHHACANNYKVTPRIIDREVKQRDIFSETISITNNKHHKINVYPSVNAVSISEGGDITPFTAPSMSDGTVTITSWLSISRAALSLEPGETKELPLSVKIHPEAEPGIYHAVVGFGTGHNRPKAEAQVASGEAPSVILTLKVEQERTEFLKLGKFIIDRFVTSAENSAISYTLSNPGEMDVVPDGEIIFYNGRGEEVGAIPVNPNGDMLTSGQETEYKIAAPVEGMMGKYKAFLSIDYGTAQLASVYDTVFFYVLPWQKLLIIFGSVLAVAVVLTVVLHRRMSKDVYDDGSDDVPMFVREAVSEDKEHDINLKKNT